MASSARTGPQAGNVLMGEPTPPKPEGSKSFFPSVPHTSLKSPATDDRRSMMKPDEGMALEKLAELDLSLDSGKPKVEVVDV